MATCAKVSELLLYYQKYDKVLTIGPRIRNSFFPPQEYLELAKNNTEVEKTDEVKKKKFRGGNKKNKNRKQKGPKRKP